MAAVDSALRPMFDVYKARADEANSLAAKIKAAQSDQSEAIDTVLSTSDDPEIVAWRQKNEAMEAQIKAAQAKVAEIREAAKAKAQALLPGADENFKVEDAKSEFLDKRKAVTALRSALLQLLGNDEAALKAAIEEFGITEVVSLGRNSTGGNAKGATNIRRPRISAATVNGEDFKDSAGKVSFTLLANHLGIDGDVLRAAAFRAAGTEDLSSLPAGTEVAFTVTKGDKDIALTVTTQGKPESTTPAEAESAPAESEGTNASE